MSFFVALLVALAFLSGLLLGLSAAQRPPPKFDQPSMREVFIERTRPPEHLNCRSYLGKVDGSPQPTEADREAVRRLLEEIE